MERCPQCRARYQGGDTCRRCGADLSILLALESRADILSRQAVKELIAGDIAAAVKKASAGHRLHNTPFSRALTGFFKHLNNEE